MSVSKTIAVFVAASVLMVLTAFPQDKDSSPARGTLLKKSPFPNMTIGKDGNAMGGGTRELEVRLVTGGHLLVVRSEDQQGEKSEDRFLTFPLDDSEPKAVRLVSESGPACKWAMSVMTFDRGTKAQTTFLAGDGPLKGHTLCFGENNSLVLLQYANSPVYRVTVYAGIDGK